MKKFNTKKIFLATFTATVMALSSGASLSAYADGNVGGATFGRNYAISDPDVYQDYLETLSDEQRQLVDEKVRMDAEAREKTPADEIHANTRSTTKYGLSGIFTMFQQKNDLLCVAACVQSMLTYVTGSSPEQDEINKVIDTQLATIPKYVNDKISVTDYVWSTDPDPSDITRRIKRDITDWNIPTFLGIIDPYGVNWFYATIGHCVLSNGIYDDETMILIADPLGGRIDNCAFFYEAETDKVAQVTVEMCW